MKTYCVGVDLGGTTVKMGLFDLNGTLVTKWEIPTIKEDKGSRILPDIADSIKQTLYEYEIEKICNENGIEEGLLKTIINLEYIYRGRWYNWLGELLACKMFPKIAIKKDLSVGLTQIRISTAKKVLKMAPNKFVKNLMEPEFNIKVCTKLLNQIINDYETSQDDYLINEVEDIYEYIAFKYLCKDYNKDNKTVLLYSAILRSKVPTLKDIKNIQNNNL